MYLLVNGVCTCPIKLISKNYRKLLWNFTLLLVHVYTCHVMYMYMCMYTVIMYMYYTVKYGGSPLTTLENRPWSQLQHVYIFSNSLTY